MVLFSTLALAGLTAAAATLRGANTTDSDAASSHVVAGAFILECESSQSLDLLVQAVQEQGGSIRRQFNSRVFYGVSVELRNTTVTEQAMKRMPGVTKVWPVEATTQPVSLPAVQEPGNQNQRRDSSASWNHVMTQVDRLHAAGFTGSGIRIAIVDTGVDYTHSALGGCFGKGCRVALGDNLARDGKANDPMDCVGHGTAVAGILGGNDANYVGVAPNATLAAYRVLDCNTFMVEDDLVAGWLKAYEDGAQIIVSSAGWPGSGWATRAAAVVVSRIVDSGVPCIVGLGNDKESGLFSTMNPSSGRGVTSVNAFARASGALDGHVRDAPMARFSSYGPNWDLDIKPTVGAPGDDVPSIQRGGGYTDVSGTSFAGPLVGGILALMAEVRGTFDPVLLNSLLSSTAVPQGSPYSVAQQGGGLVRVWDAAHATTLVEPASLAFNDTLHRAESLSLRITNTGRTNATYHLGSIAADTLYTVAPDGGLGQSAPARETADVKLSQHVLILGPGESASVDISATDPTVLDAGRLPVWSGWISINSSAGINGSDGGSLTIPYLGLSGSLKEHTVLPSNGAILSDLKNEPGWGPYDKELFDGQFIDYEINNDGSVGLHVPLRVKSNFGSPLARVEVVPISPRKWLVDRLQSKNLKLDAFSLEGLSHNSEPTRKVWNGRLPWGDYLLMGRYKLAVRALRVLGDSAIESDWDLSETVEFFVSKGPGEKACEIYEPGKTIPEKALFVSREECLQVQGNVGAELPWVLAPQEATASTVCTDDNITAEYCGSYRFCKAHDDTNLSSNLKSPFSTSVDCARSYKPLPVLPEDVSRLSECGATRKESVCGTRLWCLFKFGLRQPGTNFGSSQECEWAHGIF